MTNLTDKALRERAGIMARAIQRGSFSFRQADRIISQALRAVRDEAREAAAKEADAFVDTDDQGRLAQEIASRIRALKE